MTATADPIQSTSSTPIFRDLVEEKIGVPSIPDFATKPYEDPKFFELDSKLDWPTVADIEHDIDLGLTEEVAPGAYVAEIEPIVDAQVAGRHAMAEEQEAYEDPATETFAPVDLPGARTVTINMAEILAEDDEEPQS